MHISKRSCCAAALALLMLFGTGFPKAAAEPAAGVSPAAPTAAPAAAAGFEPVLSDGGLTLYYKSETAEIAVYSEQTGEFTYSNPQDIPETAKGTPYHRMMSQLYITYYENNSQIKYYTSYFDSLGRDQVTYTVENDRLSVNYVFGQRKITKEMLPVAVPKKKFEEKVLPFLNEEDTEALLKQYKLISSKDSLSDAMREKYEESYRNFSGTDLYILNTYIPDFQLEPTYDLLFAGEYTSSDASEDNAAAGQDVEVEDTAVIFELTLNYSLQNGALRVELDCSKLRVLDNADIYSVSVLEFFGCGGAGDDGYCVIPDGCGGLVRFNSGRTAAAAFSAPVYGNDYSIRSAGLDDNGVQVQLPVFGISRNRTGIFAVADDTAGYLSVTTDPADETIPYTVACFRADINPFDRMTVANPVSGGGTTQVFVRQKTPYQGVISIDYYFLETDRNTWSDMAVFYREMLAAEGVLTERVSGDAPFVYGLLGGIDVQKHFLGIPYRGMQSLTTFSEAQQIIDELAAAGVRNQTARYYAWFNGGMKQTLPQSVSVLSCLGGKKGLKKLMENGTAAIYPNLMLATTNNALFDGFSVRNDAARLTYNEAALHYPVSLPKNTFDFTADYTYVVSPARYDRIIGKFLKKYDYDRIALEDLAAALNSDFATNRYTDRRDSLTLTAAALERLAGQCEIMADSPNLYAVKYVSVMTDMPLTTSGANIFDAEVPFLQTVFSGYKDMATGPINLSYGDFSATRLLRFGVLPNYTFSFAESSTLLETDYADLYSVCYADWLDEAAALYTAVADVLKPVRGQSVTGHTVTAEGVDVITYENGCVLAVNDTASDLPYDGAVLKAKTFSMKEVG